MTGFCYNLLFQNSYWESGFEIICWCQRILENLWWKSTFYGSRPLIENDFWCNSTFGWDDPKSTAWNGRQPLTEYNNWWKTSSDGKKHSIEDVSRRGVSYLFLLYLVVHNWKDNIYICCICLLVGFHSRYHNNVHGCTGFRSCFIGFP